MKFYGGCIGQALLNATLHDQAAMPAGQLIFALSAGSIMPSGMVEFPKCDGESEPSRHSLQRSEKEAKGHLYCESSNGKSDLKCDDITDLVWLGRPHKTDVFRPTHSMERIKAEPTLFRACESSPVTHYQQGSQLRAWRINPRAGWYPLENKLNGGRLAGAAHRRALVVVHTYNECDSKGVAFLPTDVNFLRPAVELKCALPTMSLTHARPMSTALRVTCVRVSAARRSGCSANSSLSGWWRQKQNVLVGELRGNHFPAPCLSSPGGTAS